MKKIVAKAIVPVLFVVCFGLMFYFAYVDHQKEARIQADLSGVDVCGVYLGEDASYDETVKAGYKAVCYVLSVENRSHHKMDNMIMEQHIQISPPANMTHMVKADLNYRRKRAALR